MNDRVSHLVTAFKSLNENLKPYSNIPDGMFGRVATIESGGVKINSADLDFEFTVPFDDDVEANEAEIIIYNLSKTTIQELKVRNEITITAGYKNDIGVIFKGNIAKVNTIHEGVDRKTIIRAFAYIGGAEEELKDKTFAKGTKASYILKNLIGYLDLPCAVFKVQRDWTYKDEVKISGEIWSEIKKYAEVCGISVYVNNGLIYARSLKEGDNINFTVSAETGLIGSPEEFEEEITAEDYTDRIHGYNCKMLLQHRITTAAIANLKTIDISGSYRVRKGKHIFNSSEAVTEFEVV